MQVGGRDRAELRAAGREEEERDTRRRERIAHDGGADVGVRHPCRVTRELGRDRGCRRATHGDGERVLHGCGAVAEEPADHVRLGASCEESPLTRDELRAERITHPCAARGRVVFGEVCGLDACGRLDAVRAWVCRRARPSREVGLRPLGSPLGGGLAVIQPLDQRPDRLDERHARRIAIR